MLRSLLFTAGISFMATNGYSQVYIDGVNMNADTAVQYIEVVHSAYPNSFYVETIDMGKGYRPFARITDSSGKRMKIESSIQLEQHFKRNGWSLLRRDMVYQSKHDASGAMLVFLLYQKRE